jgi:hypothetical protein
MAELEYSFVSELRAAWPNVVVDVATVTQSRVFEGMTMTLSVYGTLDALVARGLLKLADAESLPSSGRGTRHGRKIRRLKDGRLSVESFIYDPPGRQHQHVQEAQTETFNAVVAALAPRLWRPPTARAQ